MPIITNHAQRFARAAEKRRLLLRFLREELYTTPKVAGLVMGVGERAARQTLAPLEAAGLIKRWPIQLFEGLQSITIVGITTLGQAHAFDPATEKVIDRQFDPARFSVMFLQHTLDIQRLRIEATASGQVKQWVNGDRLAAVKQGEKKPDAVLLTCDGLRIAIEAERSIKSPKRYAAIVEGHLNAMHQGKWQRVVWTFPEANTMERVQAMVLGVNRVRIAGIDTLIDPAKHHQNFRFCLYNMFTESLA
ncbi:MobC family replication-relaxation protein [Thiomonas arsenitoxydans]|uniref:MobC protein n=1 Tax=Thiomonas arsenitoxydans (strain DSM 22701 / CIP 110005 / 3As) TaxID=426114 RepID=D6CTV5_THIA3|nr:MobC family replication-relaxation protein [Thiomonas arsenitoxydans]CAZ88724.1 putative mobC protein [Thiomonas arsenitoxydans]